MDGTVEREFADFAPVVEPFLGCPFGNEGYPNDCSGRSRPHDRGDDIGDNEAHDRYHPGEDRSLSDAVLEAIERQKGHDLTRESFRLYDDVDPDALDNLFREDANADTSVKFDTGDVTVTLWGGVTVTLWGDGAVDIRVTPRDE